MSDVRALLKAKRQEARVTHPLASYTSTGQLRCIACGTAVKHASAWEGHIGSKAHRTNAARLREERAREEERERERERESLKRKMAEMEVEDMDEDGDEDVPMGDAKRRRTESVEPEPATPSAGSKHSALPADFFSNPSMAPVLDDNEDVEEEGDTTAPAGTGSGHQDVLDLEWQKFQESVLNAPDYHETYERATVAAEPVLSTEVPQGFPSAAGDVIVGGEQEEDEETRRNRKAQEERELIMDRLIEEEQAQEEADAKVSRLKDRLEALKRQREAAKAAKRAAKTS